jgi:hypothetical protein
MMKKLALLGIVLALQLVGFTQNLAKAPGYLSVEAGSRILLTSDMDISTTGTTLGLDYAWQLSGYDGKPAGYIAIPFSYTRLFTGKGASKATMLSLGWSVRHDLKALQKNLPFLGYGMYLNQLIIDGKKGSSLGHQTQINVGYLFNDDGKFSPYIKFEYSFTRYPNLEQSPCNMVNSLELKAGIRL